MSLIRFLVQSAGVWWIFLGIPTLGAIAGAMPPRHPLVALAAFIWVVGVIPACVLSGTAGRPMRASFKAAYEAGRTWLLIVGSIGAAGVLLALAIR